jgi:hypothetical protein
LFYVTKQNTPVGFMGLQESAVDSLFIVPSTGARVAAPSWSIMPASFRGPSP